MPLNAMDVDDITSQGETQGDEILDSAEKEFMKPYTKAKGEADWYAMLQKMFGVPGKLAEEKLMAAGKAQYEQAKQRFMDAMMGGENGKSG